jgi:excinuclease ABC subunit C
MSAVPRSLVCADISTAQGKDTVGSIVWFENGRPRRGDYRTYRMKTVEGQDDFASMREIVGRFFRRRIEEQQPLPDLFVVDGGKGQLAAALEAAAQHDVSGTAFASLAKRDEEIFLPGHSEPLRLPRRSPSLRLLQRARDEAHRIAVTFGRKRRAARTITSRLLEIPGVGPARRRVLLETFGSLAGVRSASTEELMSVPGISRTMAERIRESLARLEA